MALQVPTVVSPVGVNPEIVRHGENGLLAVTEDEWVNAVGNLVEDSTMRQRLGAAGRQTVVDRYSGQAWAAKFLQVLQLAAR
jgi:glycosyltransferase involved in cell wall biosynthesis